MAENKRFENRLNKENIKFNTLNPVWDNGEEDALNVFEMIDLLNELNDDNCQLKRKVLDMEMDRDYYRTKSSSLEEGYIQLQRENEQLKKRLTAIAYYFRDGVTRNDLDDKDFEDLKQLSKI